MSYYYNANTDLSIPYKDVPHGTKLKRVALEVEGGLFQESDSPIFSAYVEGRVYPIYLYLGEITIDTPLTRKVG